MTTARAQAAVARFDIAVYDTEGELALVVEVKNKTKSTPDWAAQMRRNLAVHLGIPRSRFFLLALPDHFYLWRAPANSLEVVAPDYDIDPVPLLAGYVEDAQYTLSGMSEYGLALAVLSWLTSLVRASHVAGSPPREQEWLFTSGLYEAIEGGTIEAQDER
jgi:hypothetical protein